MLNGSGDAPEGHKSSPDPFSVDPARMAAVCLYFQVHQPYRLRRYSVFDVDAHYFDDATNAELCRRIARRCYLPANALMLELIRRGEGCVCVAYSISGVALEQFERYAPEVIPTFRALADTGRVEFLGETYSHSLASLFSPREFAEQVELHRATIARLFGQRPSVFRNTELIYSDAIGAAVGGLGFDGCLLEGERRTIGERSLASVFHAPHDVGFRLLPRNYRLSDDMTFRFADRTWDQWPLTAERFAAWTEEAGGANVFIDYESIGEHLDADTGIFQFVEHLPAAILDRGLRFETPRERIAAGPVESEPLRVPTPTSWADTERDASAWLGNAMQENAARELYKLESAIRDAGDGDLLNDWRRLQGSDHFYYMSTKYFSDGDVHKYFSPYESPYDSYINFMNVLDNLKVRAGG